MLSSTVFFVLVLLTFAGFYMGRSKAVSSVSGELRELQSLPGYYGYYVAIWCGLPVMLLLGLWFSLEPRIIEMILISEMPERFAGLSDIQLNLLINDIHNLAQNNITSRQVDAELMAVAERYAALKQTSAWAMMVATLSMAIAGLTYGQRSITPAFKASNFVEKVIMAALIASSTIAVLTTIGIVLSLLFESIRFFNMVSPADFLFGLEWSPQTALRPDQVGSSGLFGAIPLLTGTLLISFIAMMVAAPVGLLSAMFMAEYANPRFRAAVKPLLEILAGVPTVVYGFFAALTVAPLFRGFGVNIGLDISSESALAAGAVMGIMIIPFVSSMSDDAIRAVPLAMREGSMGLGATKSETIKRVIFPAALPGIIGGLLLAVSRAIGETMIVVMAAGLSANLTANPLEAVTTITVQIVSLLTGDQEFDSPKTLSAFALGLLLFVVTLILNIIALKIVKKFREKYD